MKTRILVLMLALVLMLSLFAACGSAGTSASADVSASSAEAGTVSGADENSQPVSIEYPVGNGETYTISVVMDDNLLNYVPNQDPGQANGMRLMQEVTGINLDYSVYAMMSEELSLAIMSGSYTDIYCKINENYSTGLEGALNDEVIIDLAPYMDLAPDYIAQVNSDPLYQKLCYTDDGHIGAFMNFSVPNVAGWAIRGDWLEEAGIADVPETYDELEQAGLAILDHHPELSSVIPIGSSFIAEGYECELMYGYGLNTTSKDFVREDDGSVVYAWTTDGAKDYLSMLAKWVDLGILNRDEMISGDMADFGTRLYLGQAAAKHNGSDMWGNEMLAMVEDENFELVPMYEPTVNKGDTLQIGASESNASPGWSISCDCQNVEILVQAINWLYTEEGMVALNFGEEGVSYTKDADGYHFTDLVLNNPDGVQLFMAVALYTGFETPTIGMQEQADAKLGNQQQLDAQAFWSTQNRNNDRMPRGSLTTDENTAVTDAGIADIDTYVKEHALAFAVGDTKLDDAAWDDFVTTIRNMGIAEVEACYQAAQDRWDAK